MKIPSEIKKRGTEGLLISWQGGGESFISSKTLRQNCPAADSRAERGDQSHDKPLTAKKKTLMVVEHTIEEATVLEQVWQVGNYAIGIKWQDGHDNGIYTYDLLNQLAEKEKNLT